MRISRASDAASAAGFPGNDCAPDLDLSAVPQQNVLPGQTVSLDLLGIGGTAIDLDLAEEPTGDALRFLLDPDIGEDTPEGAAITSEGLFTWTPSDTQIGEFQIVVLLIDEGTPVLADAETFTVIVSDGNNPPVIDLNGSDTDGVDFDTQFQRGGEAVPAVAADLAITDTNDSELTSATVTLTNVPDGANERVGVETAGTSIVADYNSATGRLSLTGNDSIENYETVLRTLTYGNSSVDPDSEDRIIFISVNDGQDMSNVATSTITIEAANDAPSLDLNGDSEGIDFAADFVEDGGPVSIVGPDLFIQDNDGETLFSATVDITNLLDGTDEQLAVDTAATAINATYDAVTGTLNLTGVDSIDNYEQVLRSLMYDNASQDPSPTDRVIEIVVNDGEDNSPVATSVISLSPENDSPNLVPIPDQQVALDQLLEVTVSATDPDSGDTLTLLLDSDDAPESAELEQIDDNTAVIRWTPTGSGDFNFRVLVTDDGDPPLVDAEQFTVTVTVEAIDLVAFAQALSDAGAEYYGAAWCSACTEQKELFEDGSHFLPFVDVSNPDRSLNEIGIEKGIESIPTWDFPPTEQFPNGSRLTGPQDLATLAERAGVPIPTSDLPFIAPVEEVTLLAGSPLHIPLDGYDSDGDPLTYVVTSDDDVVTPTLLEGNRSLRIDVEAYGEMIFELFEKRVPRATEQITTLAENGFYDGVIFDRVVNGLMIQAGGQAESGLGNFDDQFHADLQHNRSGVLSMTKSTDDTSDTEFFITEIAARSLDFNHSIVGQLVEGEGVREAISNTAVTGSEPDIDVVIETTEVFVDEENAVVMLSADEGATGTADVTVRVSDEDGNTLIRTFVVNVQPDSSNGGPFLEDIPTIQTTVNTPVEFQLSAIDVEGDPVVYSAVQSGTTEYSFAVDSSSGEVTVTPPADFVGAMEILVRVRPATTSDTTDRFDSQVVSIEVLPENTPDQLADSEGEDDASDCTDQCSIGP